MKIPEKATPVLFVLLVVASFLLGRYQAQIEILKGGTSQPTAVQGGQQVAGQQTDPQGSQQPSAEEITDEVWQTLLDKPAAVKGENDAPVTMVEFTDYQCPYCARFFSDTYPQVLKDYVETGEVRYLVRDFPLPIHPNAPAAAMAARCAGDQGQYWEMHDKLFEKQDEWSSGKTTDLFQGYASELGLNEGEFTSCLTDEKYKQEVDADSQLARQVGINGTPGFVINGEVLIGAQPYSAFQQVFEKAQQ